MAIGNQDEPVNAIFVDQSGRRPNDYRPLKPLLIPKARIDAEIERLAAGPFRGSRRAEIVNPALMGSGSLYPAVTVSINVLLPGERTTPHRHNSSVVNFGIQGSGASVIGGRTIAWSKYDTWSTPPWMVHQHVNDTDEIQVRLSYSNSGLLDLLGVHVFEDASDLDPNQPLGDPQAERELSARGETIGEDGAALLTYEQLISPEPPYQPALHWPYPEIHQRLQHLRSLGQEYKGRRLFLMYDRTTGRSQGTTSTFFATITMRPAGIVDEPHRHTSAAINYIFTGKGWSIVGGQRYEWGAGDLMLTAPGWMNHGHATYEGDDVYELTIQDSPLQIAVGSLLWVENLKNERTEALGVTPGYETNRETLVGS
ncbi:1-hydroxy-2-naphthoate 1,2-dioxygenasee [Baekduia alba]|uniref:cupin domain-containing protein n=1 Tax=Baekduia alba TaxID=2997333 RepID=UPI002341D227|nr:cupin domain-containing protein [Baekduia alba]WCB95315.1 1-hydroxy-2-naphthoate 1,2-dioxygenasee [Baekduia alba]